MGVDLEDIRLGEGAQYGANGVRALTLGPAGFRQFNYLVWFLETWTCQWHTVNEEMRSEPPW